MTAGMFGHAPVWVNAGYCGGCPECGDWEEGMVCARCVIPAGYKLAGYLAPWPCATARVLGIADLEPES